MDLKLCVFIIILLREHAVQSARILAVLPSPSFSHQVMFQPVLRELSLRGHQVVSITPNPINDASLSNITEIDISFMYTVWKNKFQFSKGERFVEHSQKNAIRDFIFAASDISNAELSHPPVKQLIQNKKERFDLVIVEWLFYPSLYAFSERFKCPLVGIVSLGNMLNGHVALGNPLPLAYDSDMNVPYVHPMTFWERLDGMMYNIWYLYYYYFYLLPSENRVARKHFGDGIPYLRNIENKVSMIIINSHPAWAGVRPNVPAVVEVGGMHRPKRAPLPQELQLYLDNATDGAIYFSFGSNVKSALVAEDKIQIFLQVFSELPYKVLWKWESDQLPGQPENVKLAKWFPQNDILGHENVKAFITQGGLQSLEESIHNKVPVVAIPFFGDQHGNARRVESLGIGKRLSFQSLNKEDLKKAIESVVGKRSYKEKITELSNQLDDQIVPPLEKAVWWIEYVIRHKGAKHLRSPAADMSWIQSSMTDVFLFLGLCALLTIVLIVFVLRMLISVLLINRRQREFLNKQKKNKQT